MEELRGIYKKMTEIEISVEKLPATLRLELEEAFDKKYATKKTERTVDWLIKLVVGTVVLGVLALVIKT